MAYRVPESFENDHALLHELVASLHTFVRPLPEQPVDVGKLSDYARFFRVFGDAHYSSKLSEVLLPNLARSSASLDPQFVADVRGALQLQRYHVESLEQRVGAGVPDGAADRRELRALVEEFVASHHHVDVSLRATAFPLLAELSDGEWSELNLELEQFDRASLTTSDRPEVARIAQRLRGSP